MTGAAGFIGSHLVEQLLKLGQSVVGLDDFSTGTQANLDAVTNGARGWKFVRGDCADLGACRAASEGADVVLHQAALGSVPRSIEDPLRTHRANVDGFVNMLVAARDARVRRFVYASSSSVYGDDFGLPKIEDRVGRVLSPYAASKRIGEVYAGTFEKAYGLSCIGLRYFNVFGPRQDPNGAYAAVVPRWIARLMRGEPCEVFGDGGTSRDFCYVANVVQANLLAATAERVTDTVMNVSVGGRTSLLELYAQIRDRVAVRRPDVKGLAAVHKPPRAGDIRDSQADVSRATRELGYAPTHDLPRGLDETVRAFAS